MNFKNVLLLALLGMFTIQTGFAQKKGKKVNKTENTISAVVEPANDEKNMEESISYAFGVVLGNNLKQTKINDLDLDVLKQGIADVLEGKTTMSNEAAGQMVNEHMAKVQEEASKGQREAGEKFLEENKAKDGVTVLPSGLQFEVLTKGTGPFPKSTDRVTTHYHGTLIDGTVFDSSVDRGQPATFPVNGVIQGWQEALVLMPVGSKWRLYVPSDLAYGARGAGQTIGPHSTLIFDVELLKIEE